MTTNPAQMDVVSGKNPAFAQAVLECSPDCLKVLDARGNILFFNTNGLCAMEIDDFDQVEGQFWPSLWPDAEAPRVAVETALTGNVGAFQGFCPTAKGAQKFWDVLVSPVPNENGPIERLIVISRDITAQRADAERKAALASELGHRINNTLTVVMAIASQTRRATNDINGFFEAFSGRLRAISAATAAIIQGKWEGVSVRTLAETQLQSYLTAGQDRIRLEGPEVSVPIDHAQGLALMLNELATNAIKYGALSNKTGKVSLRWYETDGDGKLRVEWCESGGPPVTPPTRTGLGSALLSSGVVGAKVETRFEPSGLICVITLDR